jgi:hypothetical protein
MDPQLDTTILEHISFQLNPTNSGRCGKSIDQ